MPEAAEIILKTFAERLIAVEHRRLTIHAGRMTENARRTSIFAVDYDPTTNSYHSTDSPFPAERERDGLNSVILRKPLRDETFYFSILE